MLTLREKFGQNGATPAAQMLTPLAAHPSLERGMLPNGLRYAILPLAAAPWSRDRRVAVHLEVHVGSIDEGETEHLTQTRNRSRNRNRTPSLTLTR